jgi:hypothetical protein
MIKWFVYRMVFFFILHVMQYYLPHWIVIYHFSIMIILIKDAIHCCSFNIFLTVSHFLLPSQLNLIIPSSVLKWIWLIQGMNAFSSYWTVNEFLYWNTNIRFSKSVNSQSISYSRELVNLLNRRNHHLWISFNIDWLIV